LQYYERLRQVDFTLVGAVINGNWLGPLNAAW
jgi:hypothetical protein